MTNAKKFTLVFGEYATELWAKPENEFLEWLNAKFERLPIPVRNHSNCPECGKLLTEQWDYCPGCGGKLDWAHDDTYRF